MIILILSIDFYLRGLNKIWFAAHLNWMFVRRYCEFNNRSQSFRFVTKIGALISKAIDNHLPKIDINSISVHFAASSILLPSDIPSFHSSSYYFNSNLHCRRCYLALYLNKHRPVLLRQFFNALPITKPSKCRGI